MSIIKKGTKKKILTETEEIQFPIYKNYKEKVEKMYEQNIPLLSSEEIVRMKNEICSLQNSYQIIIAKLILEYFYVEDPESTQIFTSNISTYVPYGGSVTVTNNIKQTRFNIDSLPNKLKHILKCYLQDLKD